MWNWLKDIGQKAVANGAAYMQHRNFIQSLFNMSKEQALWALKQKIVQLDDQGIQMFGGVLTGMINEAQQAAQQSTGNDAWGTSVEDRIAYSMAHIQAGMPAQQNTQAQNYLDGLKGIAYFANQFYQEKLARATQAQYAVPQPSNQPTTSGNSGANAMDMSQLESMIEKMLESGQLDPELVKQLSSLNDPAALERVLAKLREMGADEGGSPQLGNIADYFRPRNIKYQLKWPLAFNIPLPVPFDQLDEETQFHVLFGEWTRREMEGQLALNGGDLAAAESIFNECLQRAEQIAIPELKARSYEGFMRIAQRTGDRTAEKNWIAQAKSARAGSA